MPRESGLWPIGEGQVDERRVKVLLGKASSGQQVGGQQMARSEGPSRGVPGVCGLQIGVHSLPLFRRLGHLPLTWSRSQGIGELRNQWHGEWLDKVPFPMPEIEKSQW